MEIKENKFLEKNKIGNLERQVFLATKKYGDKLNRIGSSFYLIEITQIETKTYLKMDPDDKVVIEEYIDKLFVKIKLVNFVVLDAINFNKIRMILSIWPLSEIDESKEILKAIMDVTIKDNVEAPNWEFYVKKVDSCVFHSNDFKVSNRKYYFTNALEPRNLTKSLDRYTKAAGGDRYIVMINRFVRLLLNIYMKPVNKYINLLYIYMNLNEYANRKGKIYDSSNRNAVIYVSTLEKFVYDSADSLIRFFAENNFTCLFVKNVLLEYKSWIPEIVKVVNLKSDKHLPKTLGFFQYVIRLIAGHYDLYRGFDFPSYNFPVIYYLDKNFAQVLECREKFFEKMNISDAMFKQLKNFLLAEKKLYENKIEINMRSNFDIQVFSYRKLVEAEKNVNTIQLEKEIMFSLIKEREFHDVMVIFSNKDCIELIYDYINLFYYQTMLKCSKKEALIAMILTRNDKY